MVNFFYKELREEINKAEFRRKVIILIFLLELTESEEYFIAVFTKIHNNKFPD